MSEYQYYEFQAIDQPLDDDAMDELRKITSRAEITRHRLFNEYHWGDFKGNPLRLMEDYFDGHMYYANWGTRTLMLRLPRKSFDPAEVAPYLLESILECHVHEESVILDFTVISEDREEIDFSGYLDTIVELRADLMAGDFRCLYLGWLAGLLDENGVDPSAVEPPMPPGLRKLNRPLANFAEFLDLPNRLLQVALEGSPSDEPPTPPDVDPAEWIAQLSSKEKDNYLLQLFRGEGAKLQGELLHRFRKETAQSTRSTPILSPRRTAGQLLERYEVVLTEANRLAGEKKAKELEAQELAKREARKKYLNELAGRQEAAWKEIDEGVATRKPKEYDRATTLLTDLRDIAIENKSEKDFVTRLRTLAEKHAAKAAFQERLKQAKLLKTIEFPGSKA